MRNLFNKHYETIWKVFIAIQFIYAGLYAFDVLEPSKIIMAGNRIVLAIFGSLILSKQKLIDQLFKVIRNK